MKIARYTTGMAFAVALAAGSASAQDFMALPLDEVVTVGGVDVACTGFGLEAREDPRWREFPIRIEVAGGDAQFLGEMQIDLATTGGEPILSVSCRGPWLLLMLDAGKYSVSASAAGAGPRRETITVPRTGGGQARAVIRFPEVTGSD